MFRIPVPNVDWLGDYSFFTDESGLGGHRYLLIGGVSCATKDAVRLHHEIISLRNEHPYPNNSLQWKELTTAKKVPKYKRLIDKFILYNSEHLLDFSVIIIDTKKLDHDEHNDGDGETFFQKMMCEFVESRVRQYWKPRFLRCFHGERESKYDLAEIQNIINSTIAADRNEFLFRPLAQLEHMPVSPSGLHHLADLLLGCVAFHWNIGMQVNPNSPKAEIAKYLYDHGPANSLAEQTPSSQRHFDIWEFKLRG